jgi:hypothetical protein
VAEVVVGLVAPVRVEVRVQPPTEYGMADAMHRPPLARFRPQGTVLGAPEIVTTANPYGKPFLGPEHIPGVGIVVGRGHASLLTARAGTGPPCSTACAATARGPPRTTPTARCWGSAALSLCAHPLSTRLREIIGTSLASVLLPPSWW